MKLPFLNTKKKDDNWYASDLIALDIGTEFVKTVIFNLQGDKVNILSYKRVRQQPDAMKGAMIINLRNVVENCNLALSEALKELPESKPKYMILGIAGELVQGITIVANMKRENPDVAIDKAEIDEVINKVKEKAFQNALDDVAKKTGIDPDQLEEIDTVVNDTFIDGFRVGDPIGFKGTEIKFKIFTTFAPSIHASSLRSLAEQLGYEILNIVAEPYAIARSIYGARDDSFSSIIIDIGGGTTDVAIVQRGGIVGTEMFAFGGRVFTRRLEHSLNLDYNNAEKMKLRYSKKDLEEINLKKVRDLIAMDSSVWIDGFELALSEFDDVNVYPSEILLCGGGSLLGEIKEEIISHPWLKVLPFNRFPRVSYLQPDKLDSINDQTGEERDPADIAPFALARYTLDLSRQERDE